jgi:hypothetical protein
LPQLIWYKVFVHIYWSKSFSSIDYMNKVYMSRWKVGDKNDKRFWVHLKTQLLILESSQACALGPSRLARISSTCRKSMIMTWNDPHDFTIITSLVYIQIYSLLNWNSWFHPKCQANNLGNYSPRFYHTTTTLPDQEKRCMYILPIPLYEGHNHLCFRKEQVVTIYGWFRPSK